MRAQRLRCPQSRDRFRIGQAGNRLVRLREVMDMRRYLLVLNTDLLAADEDHTPGPVSYLAAKQEQEQCEVTVLSLVDTSQTKLPTAELLLGAQVGKMPVAPKADHDISAAAEHRMNLAVRHLQTTGCQVSGLISDQDLVKAVRAETSRHDYDEIILVTGQQGNSGVGRLMGRDPVQQLRRKWGERLIMFSEGHRS